MDNRDNLKPKDAAREIEFYFVKEDKYFYEALRQCWIDIFDDDYRKEVVKQNHIDLIIKRLKTKEEVAQKGLICILTVLAKEDPNCLKNTDLLEALDNIVDSLSEIVKEHYINLIRVIVDKDIDKLELQDSDNPLTDIIYSLFGDIPEKPEHPYFDLFVVLKDRNADFKNDLELNDVTIANYNAAINNPPAKMNGIDFHKNKDAIESTQDEDDELKEMGAVDPNSKKRLHDTQSTPPANTQQPSEQNEPDDDNDDDTSPPPTDVPPDPNKERKNDDDVVDDDDEKEKEEEKKRKEKEKKEAENEWKKKYDEEIKKNNEKENEIKKLNEQIKELQKDKSDLQRENKDLSSRVNKQEGENSELNGKINSRDKKIEELMNQLKSDSHLANRQEGKSDEEVERIRREEEEKKELESKKKQEPVDTQFRGLTLEGFKLSSSGDLLKQLKDIHKGLEECDASYFQEMYGMERSNRHYKGSKNSRSSENGGEGAGEDTEDSEEAKEREDLKDCLVDLHSTLSYIFILLHAPNHIPSSILKQIKGGKKGEMEIDDSDSDSQTDDFPEIDKKELVKELLNLYKFLIEKSKITEAVNKNNYQTVNNNASSKDNEGRRKIKSGIELNIQLLLLCLVFCAGTSKEAKDDKLEVYLDPHQSHHPLFITATPDFDILEIIMSKDFMNTTKGLAVYALSQPDYTDSVDDKGNKRGINDFWSICSYFDLAKSLTGYISRHFVMLMIAALASYCYLVSQPNYFSKPSTMTKRDISMSNNSSSSSSSSYTNILFSSIYPEDSNTPAMGHLPVSSIEKEKNNSNSDYVSLFSDFELYRCVRIYLFGCKYNRESISSVTSSLFDPLDDNINQSRGKNRSGNSVDWITFRSSFQILCAFLYANSKADMLSSNGSRGGNGIYSYSSFNGKNNMFNRETLLDFLPYSIYCLDFVKKYATDDHQLISCTIQSIFEILRVFNKDLDIIINPNTYAYPQTSTMNVQGNPLTRNGRSALLSFVLGSPLIYYLLDVVLYNPLLNNKSNEEALTSNLINYFSNAKAMMKEQENNLKLLIESIGGSSSDGSSSRRKNEYISSSNLFLLPPASLAQSITVISRIFVLINVILYYNIKLVTSGLNFSPSNKDYKSYFDNLSVSSSVVDTFPSNYTEPLKVFCSCNGVRTIVLCLFRGITLFFSKSGLSEPSNASEEDLKKFDNRVFRCRNVEDGAPNKSSNSTDPTRFITQIFQTREEDDKDFSFISLFSDFDAEVATLSPSYPILDKNKDYSVETHSNKDIPDKDIMDKLRIKASIMLGFITKSVRMLSSDEYLRETVAKNRNVEALLLIISALSSEKVKNLSTKALQTLAYLLNPETKALTDKFDEEDEEDLYNQREEEEEEGNSRFGGSGGKSKISAFPSAWHMSCLNVFDNPSMILWLLGLITSGRLDEETGYIIFIVHSLTLFHQVFRAQFGPILTTRYDYFQNAVIDIEIRKQMNRYLESDGQGKRFSTIYGVVPVILISVINTIPGILAQINGSIQSLNDNFYNTTQNTSLSNTLSATQNSPFSNSMNLDSAKKTNSDINFSKQRITILRSLSLALQTLSLLLSPSYAVRMYSNFSTQPDASFPRNFMDEFYYPEKLSYTSTSKRRETRKEKRSTSSKDTLIYQLKVIGSFDLQSIINKSSEINVFGNDTGTRKDLLLFFQNLNNNNIPTRCLNVINPDIFLRNLPLELYKCNNEEERGGSSGQSGSQGEQFKSNSSSSAPSIPNLSNLPYSNVVSSPLVMLPFFPYTSSILALIGVMLNHTFKKDKLNEAFNLQQFMKNLFIIFQQLMSMRNFESSSLKFTPNVTGSKAKEYEDHPLGFLSQCNFYVSLDSALSVFFMFFTSLINSVKSLKGYKQDNKTLLDYLYNPKLNLMTRTRREEFMLSSRQVSFYDSLGEALNYFSDSDDSVLYNVAKNLYDKMTKLNQNLEQ